MANGLVIFRQLIVFRKIDVLLTRIEQAESQFRLLVQNAQDITLIAEPDGVLRYAGPALSPVLQSDPRLAIGARSRIGSTRATTVRSRRRPTSL